MDRCNPIGAIPIVDGARPALTTPLMGIEVREQWPDHRPVGGRGQGRSNTRRCDAAESGGGSIGATAWRRWRRPPRRLRWQWRHGPPTTCRSATIKSVRACLGILLVVRSPLFFSRRRERNERDMVVIARTTQFIHFLFVYMRDDHQRGATAYQRGSSVGGGGAGTAPARRLPSRDEV
jgi:hypothetical protein